MTQPTPTTTSDAASSIASEIPSSDKPVPQERLVTTKHSGWFGGKKVDYTATCGTVLIREESAKDGLREGNTPMAELFFTAYTKDGVSSLGTRPITFCFNGGPGSSSIWLHMLLFGPQRVAMDEMGRAGAPPHRLVPNEHCILDSTDLVLIDPIGTGYSRMLSGKKVSEFHDIKRDVESVGEFIRMYCSRNKRWASPKFIAGESYGTTRAAGLAGYLQERHGLYCNGLMLISCALDFIAFREEAQVINDLPYMLFLPTLTATAWYHKCLPADLQAQPVIQVIKQAEEFAANAYAQALFMGHRLPIQQKQEIAAQLSRLTGLSKEFMMACNLRVDEFRFFKELMRNQGKVVGRLDSRFLGADRDAGGEIPETDPSMMNLMGACATTFNHYIADVLGFDHEQAYALMTGLYKTWSWGDATNKYVSVTDILRRAMTDNPHMKVYVGNGLYDLATPHFATDYSFAHLNIPDELRSNITTHTYEAGHMMYIHQPSLVAQAQHLREFIAASTA